MLFFRETSRIEMQEVKICQKFSDLKKAIET